MTGAEATSIRADLERVLIVEDNPFFLRFVKEALQSRFSSMVIFEAAHGEEAMQKIKTLKPKAIFTDLRLPGENGLKLTKRIKSQYPNIIVVIITNYDLPEYREAAYRCKADHFLSKDSFLNMISILPDRETDQNDSLRKERF
jgi:DNA-binding NarL/FixJ family response regulator